jgi:hypothetical protein
MSNYSIEYLLRLQLFYSQASFLATGSCRKTPEITGNKSSILAQHCPVDSWELPVLSDRNRSVLLDLGIYDVGAILPIYIISWEILRRRSLSPKRNSLIRLIELEVK